MMCLKIINVSLICISIFTNNKLFILKIYKIKIFVVASARINRDIFCVNLCIYFFLLGIIHKMVGLFNHFLKKKQLIYVRPSPVINGHQFPKTFFYIDRLLSTIFLIKPRVYLFPPNKVENS
jgi:hypothetical protein